MPQARHRCARIRAHRARIGLPGPAAERGGDLGAVAGEGRRYARCSTRRPGLVVWINWQSPPFVQRYRDGEPEALRAVYCQYAPLVDRALATGFVTRTGRPAVVAVPDADRRADLRQEAFLRAFSDAARRRFDPALDYYPYLLRIARNLLIDSHRRRQREQRRLAVVWPSDALVVENVGDVEGGRSAPTWSSPSIVSQVERYTAQLGPPLRDVFHLRFVLARSQRRSASALGLSRQALRTLEARLKREVATAINVDLPTQSLRLA